MGGSFSPHSRSSSSSSSSYSPSYSRSLPSRGYGFGGSSPNVHIHLGPAMRLFGSYGPSCDTTFPGGVTAVSTGATTRFSPSDIALLTGVGVLLAYGFTNARREGDAETSPLGPGATALSLTASLQVPNRDDPDSILNKLRRISDSVDTKNRKGVQDLVSEVALELLPTREEHCFC